MEKLLLVAVRLLPINIALQMTEQPVQILQLTHLTLPIVNSMAQQNRVVRRRQHLTAIVPQ